MGGFVVVWILENPVAWGIFSSLPRVTNPLPPNKTPGQLFFWVHCFYFIFCIIFGFLLLVLLLRNFAEKSFHGLKNRTVFLAMGKILKEYQFCNLENVKNNLSKTTHFGYFHSSREVYFLSPPQTLRGFYIFFCEGYLLDFAEKRQWGLIFERPYLGACFFGGLLHQYQR